MWGFILYYYTYIIDTHLDGALAEQGGFIGPNTAQVLCIMLLVVAALVMEVMVVLENVDETCDRPIIAWHIWSIAMAMPLVIYMVVYPNCEPCQMAENRSSRFAWQGCYIMFTSFLFLIGLFCAW